MLLPLAFIVPMFLTPVPGVEEQARAPFGVFLIVLLVMAVLCAVPVLLAWRFATRARQHGDDRGTVPAILGSVAAGAVFALSVVSWLMWLLEDSV